MHRRWQVAVLLAVLLSAGCNSRPATVGLRGEVSFDGQAVAWGKIDFVPADGTPGASACSPVDAGRYEIPARWGLLPDGVYEVRIVAFRKAGKKETNRVERGGPPVETAENFIPDTYNTRSTLRIRVADLPDKNKADFRLGRPSA
jgi:hypothetical protein